MSREDGGKRRPEENRLEERQKDIGERTNRGGGVRKWSVRVEKSKDKEEIVCRQIREEGEASIGGDRRDFEAGSCSSIKDIVCLILCIRLRCMPNVVCPYTSD